MENECLCLFILEDLAEEMCTKLFSPADAANNYLKALRGHTPLFPDDLHGQSFENWIVSGLEVSNSE